MWDIGLRNSLPILELSSLVWQRETEASTTQQMVLIHSHSGGIRKAKMEFVVL